MTATCDLSIQTKRRCYIKRNTQVTRCCIEETVQVTRCAFSELSCEVVKFKVPYLQLNPRINEAIDKLVSAEGINKLIKGKPSSLVPCHTDLLFDCLLLAVGDLVVGTRPSRKGVIGKVIRLDFIDNGSWHEMKAIEVEWMDGEIGNPYPNQMAKYVGCDRTTDGQVDPLQTPKEVKA